MRVCIFTFHRCTCRQTLFPTIQALFFSVYVLYSAVANVHHAQICELNEKKPKTTLETHAILFWRLLRFYTILFSKHSMGSWLWLLTRLFLYMRVLWLSYIKRHDDIWSDFILKMDFIQNTHIAFCVMWCVPWKPFLTDEKLKLNIFGQFVSFVCVLSLLFSMKVLYSIHRQQDASEKQASKKKKLVFVLEYGMSSKWRKRKENLVSVRHSSVRQCLESPTIRRDKCWSEYFVYIKKREVARSIFVKPNV